MKSEHVHCWGASLRRTHVPKRRQNRDGGVSLSKLIGSLAARISCGVSFNNGLILCVCRFSNHASFQEILNELNDYAGQRELVAENLMTGICVELSKYLQDLKQERKGVREGEGEREGGRGSARMNAIFHSLLSSAPF